ncbi:MAG: hypothetical protein H0X17_02875, partial [Deltaproteobacteria bacterium]|nr:hypothetical protein [Deltaproteobacteria bacterium]
AGPPGAALAAALGSVPGPFGALAGVTAGMTRAEVVTAVPTAQPDGPLLWAPTGLDGVDVDIAFSPNDRLEEIVYRLPLAARPQLVTAWGAPVHETNLWFDPARGWRARLDEDPVNGKVELVIRPYRPFATLVRPGGGVAIAAIPVLGMPVAKVATYLGPGVIPRDEPDLVGEVVLMATEVCSEPTRLVLGKSAKNVVDRMILYQCYDDWEVQRRAVLAALERSWGRATPTRTADDRLGFAWSPPGRHILAEDTREGPGSAPVWKITVTAR